jgi:hypothetical protein
VDGVFNYLIRVHLPDRPGALGAVASRIGSVGGDVISIDILQRHDGVVVDELGVGLAEDNLIGLLRDEVLEVDGVTIESVRAVDGALPDRNTELLEVATELFEQHSSVDLLEHLAFRVHRSLDATYVAVVDLDSSEMVTCVGQPPEHDQLNALALQSMSPPPYSVEDDGTVATAAMIQADKLVIVGRESPVLRDRERQWISIMTEIADHGWRGRTPESRGA